MTHASPEFCRWLGWETRGEPELQKVADAARAWIDAFRANESPRWISIIGNSGTGKTHVATRLWDFAYQKSSWRRSEFIPKPIFWPFFVQELKAGTRWEFRNDMARWPVLFLDDIGAETDKSGFATDELNTLLGVRMNQWTIITSNRTLEAWQQTDGRILSRMVRGQNLCVSINAPDWSTRTT